MSGVGEGGSNDPLDGAELVERDLVRPYVEALEAEEQIDPAPDALRVIEP